jgi:CheY-like chemotaxis protein
MANPGNQSQPVPSLLIVEDGDEYLEFFERHLLGYRLVQAKNGREALDRLARSAVDAVVMDIRFDRIDRSELLGDVRALSLQRFGQDTDLTQAWHYLESRQGYLVTKAIRDAGHSVPILFIETIPERQAANLRRMYGEIVVVPEFDAPAIHRALVEVLRGPGLAQAR